MPATTIPAAITGFLAAARSAVGTDVSVCDGVVRTGQSVTQLVVVTGWEVDTREPAGLGTTFQIEEHYRLLGYIRCLEGSEDQTVSRGQAFTIFDQIETAVRSDPTLGSAVRVSWFGVSKGLQGPADGNRGNGTEIDFELTCEARV